jgi:hypothetical protein
LTWRPFWIASSGRNRKGLKLLVDGEGERARRVLEALSDPTTETIPKSPGKGAVGAYDTEGLNPS